MTFVDEFEYVRRFLTGDGCPGITDSQNLTVNCNKRLVQTVQSGNADVSDIACLVRHVLRRESEKTQTVQQLLVPRDKGWPSIEEWDCHGVRGVLHPSGFLRVEAHPWLPDWLNLAGGVSVEADAFAETRRRLVESCPGDPFLTTLGLEKDRYLTIGQKEAVRAVLMAPEGSTLIVNLPTGTGKSLCTQVLTKIPYINGKGDGATVVVVPTVALALDQERAVARSLDLKYPTAYRGGADDQTRANNREIWRRICDGTQSIVFVSPESLMGSLRPAVYEAAKKQLLKAFVIDEAHIVDQWGEAFRPSFQEIAGLHRALKRIYSGLRTVLMSATLSESSLSTIDALFTEPGRSISMVSAVQLRPEPSYWFSHCDDWNQKQARTLEAIDHLPRPMILYTTERSHAYSWYDKLAERGYKRLAVMTGETRDNERDHIIQQWAESSIDIVIGTSAFGLGVDKPDVRAVVHACIPETLDRFYQEVGRTGRDGNASVSIVIYLDRDIRVARSMGKARNIKIDKGLERWKNMFENKVSLREPSGSLIGVPINVGRRLHHDPESKRNVEWNVRTLTLMSRAGLIELDEVPPEPSDGISTVDDTQEATTSATSQHHGNLQRVIRVINSNHLSEEVWKAEVDPIRDRSQQVAENHFQLMQSLLDGQQCVSRAIAQSYATPFPISQQGASMVPVALACGGCALCRQDGRRAYVNEPVVKRVSWFPVVAIGAALARYLMGSPVLAIFFDASENERLLIKKEGKLLDWLLQEGIRCLIAPEVLANQLCTETPRARTLPIFVEHEYEPIHLPKVPTVLFHTLQQQLTRDLLDQWVRRMKMRDSQIEPLVLVLPNVAREPERADRLLPEVLPCSRISMDKIMRLEFL